MSDWPSQIALPDPSITISCLSACSLGTQWVTFTNGSNTWPANNRAIFVPFRLSQSIVATNLWLRVGAANTGNCDMGIYTSDGTRLVSSGATALGATSTLQVLDVVDTELGPGLFYIALALSSTSGTIWSLPSYVEHCRMAGMAQMANALALPTTVTFATITTALCPMCGLTRRSFV